MNITKSRRNIEFQLYSLFTDYVIDFQNEARNANKMASFSKECVKRSTGTAYHCYIPLCNNDSRYDNTRELSFHYFLTDKIKRKEWIIKIRRDVGQSFRVSRPTCYQIDKLIMDYKFIKQIIIELFVRIKTNLNAKFVIILIIKFNS